MFVDDATPTIDFSKIEVLNSSDCWTLLSTAKLGRLAFVESGGPVVFPVNLAVDGSAIVFRTGLRTKLFAAAMNGQVCLEVDHWDDASRTGWSILVKGFATQVAGVEAERFEGLGIANTTDDTPMPCWIRITPDEITGRRIPTT